MKEYIKKFETVASADGYVINDIPFTTSVAENPIQNLVCNQENKKLSVNGITVEVVDNATEQTVVLTGTEGLNDIAITFVQGMTWAEWIASKYNTYGMRLDYYNSVEYPKDYWLQNRNDELGQYAKGDQVISTDYGYYFWFND